MIVVVRVVIIVVVVLLLFNSRQALSLVELITSRRFQGKICHITVEIELVKIQVELDRIGMGLIGFIFC